MKLNISLSATQQDESDAALTAILKAAGLRKPKFSFLRRASRALVMGDNNATISKLKAALKKLGYIARPATPKSGYYDYDSNPKRIWVNFTVDHGGVYILCAVRRSAA